MSKILNQNLDELQQRVANLVRSVQEMLGASVVALLNSDAAKADVVCQSDQAINDERYALECDSVAVIAMHQPVARDIRLLVGMLEITSELERMGDYAKDIARITLRQTEHGSPPPQLAISQMADQAAGMLERAIAAFVAGDAQQATNVANEDSDIDKLCALLHRELLNQAYGDQAELDEAIRLLAAVHQVERFADRITNICERIVYIQKGERVEFND